MKAGTRIRMKATVAWPERAGCEGVIVIAPNGPGIYPDDPRDKDHVLVLLDEDPLLRRYTEDTGEEFEASWTCAVSRKDVEEIQ